MEATYVKTDKLTDDGQAIFHRIQGKGRPALFVEVNDVGGVKYVPWKRPLKPYVKKEKVVESAPAVAE